MPKNSCIMQILAEPAKSALPICNYSQILYRFLTFTQNLKLPLFYGRKFSPAFDMLEATLLYIKQGLNAHSRAFSPVIIIEDSLLQTFIHTLLQPGYYHRSSLLQSFIRTLTKCLSKRNIID